MQYTNLVFNLLPNLFWSITPALPHGGGGAGVRPPVGTPEPIPDKTFITREMLTNADFPDAAERVHLNGFIKTARLFHVDYGLNPVTINSLDDILTRLQAAATPIGRVRIVSHGFDQFLQCPVFTNGSFAVGMQPDLLQALQSADATGLRFIMRNNAATSPLLPDGVDTIVTGLRVLDATKLAPFGLAAAGLPAGVSREFFEIVNDLYMVPNATLFDSPGPALLNAAKQATLTASLNLIEQEIRPRLVGTTPPGGVALNDGHLTNLKNAVLGATPAQLGFFGPPRNLAATVVADVQAAIAGGGTPRDIRIALVGVDREPALAPDYLSGMIGGLEHIKPNVLKLAGVPHDDARIRGGDQKLEKFALSCIDLHHFKNVGVLINGGAPSGADKTALHNALLALSNLLRADAVASAVNPIPAGQLNALRTAIEDRPPRESVITEGWWQFDPLTLTELAAANAGMAGGFRARLNAVRGLMKAGNASHIDIRGCRVGAAPAFLDLLRDFLGAANKPTITAPDWWQSYPTGLFIHGVPMPSVRAAINSFVASGDAANAVTAQDVADSLLIWRGLINFDLHFAFISALFAAAASKRDFASLAWRAWNPPNANGIPVLLMEAARIDDIDSLATLAAVIDRFQAIFEIGAADMPNAAARTRLNALQPHVATFNPKNTEIVAGVADQARRDQLLADLTPLSAAIAAIAAPAAPFNAPAAGLTLADLQGFATAIRNHLDATLATDLNPFFAAVRARLGDPNAAFWYYYNIGLPLLVHSTAQPTAALVSVFASAPTGNAVSLLHAAALRSWMRIQWAGTAAQAAAMNTAIANLAITNAAQQLEATRQARVSQDDPVGVVNSPAEMSPMPGFSAHIVTRP